MHSSKQMATRAKNHRSTVAIGTREFSSTSIFSQSCRPLKSGGVHSRFPLRC